MPGKNLMWKTKNFVKYLLGKFYEILSYGRNHPYNELVKISRHSTAIYIEKNLYSAISFYSPKDLLAYSLGLCNLNGEFLEFGVYKAGSINFIASKITSKTIWGFDSFQGLPKSWFGTTYKAGDFSLNGSLPKVRNNVVLIKGLFSETLDKWLSNNHGKISFLHVDCDIYESTVDIFDRLNCRLERGAIILFDEYFGYPFWENHEFKAWKESCEKHHFRYEYLGYSYQQVSLRII